MFRRFLSGLLFFMPVVIVAQPRFNTVPGSLKLHVNEVLQVTYMMENTKTVEHFQLPVFKDFKVVQGPVQSEGTIITDGQYSQYSAMTYVLQPLRKGNLNLPGAIATIDGKKMTSNRVLIEVGDRSNQSPNPYPRNPGISAFRQQPEEDYLLKEKENASEKIRKNLLVKLQLSKTTAYVGEPIVSTYKLYTRLRSESRVSKRPSLNGFSVYDMVEPDRTGPVSETLGGKTFMSHIIRKTQLIPLQEGDFVLEPVELDNKIQFLRVKPGGSTSNPSAIEKMFEGFFDRPEGEPESYQLSLSSEPQKIHIKPLPEGAPASFNGAVGDFSISGHLTDSSIKAGEPVTYELSIEGKGNLPMLTAPEWDLPNGLETMDPIVSDTIDKSVAPMEGKKVFNYQITPDSAGRILLPAIEFSYFDPSTATYKSLHTDSIQLLVTAGAIRKSNHIANNKQGRNHWLLVGGISTAALLLGFVGVLLRRKEQRKEDQEKLSKDLERRQEQKTVRQAKRPKIVREPIVAPQPIPRKDPLAAARTALKENQPTAYYHGLEKALWEVIVEKLALPGSAQQQPQVLQQLAAAGMAADDLQALRELWNTCDWILYLPASSHQIDPLLYPKTEALLKKINAL